MWVNRLAGTVFLAAGVFALASCSEQSVAAPAVEVNAAPSDIDYAALLTRTDSAEVCLREMQPAMNEKYGVGFQPPSYTLLGCRCWVDMVGHSVEQVVIDEPVLQNAVLQMATNLDVMSRIFNEKRFPGALDAFAAFFEEGEAESVLGFNAEVLSDAVQSASAHFTVYEEDPFLLLNDVPSCALAYEVRSTVFSQWDPATGDHGFEAMLAAQELKHAQSLD